MDSPRLTHIALHVDKLDACIIFYQTYCGLHISHQRTRGNQTIVWLSEPGREQDFVIVMMGGGHSIPLPKNDYRHFGFAVSSKSEVDRLASQAEEEGCLLWPPRQEPFPVGYYCGVVDPSGNQVEFSYGQPLGPGAEEAVGSQ